MKGRTSVLFLVFIGSCHTCGTVSAEDREIRMEEVTVTSNRQEMQVFQVPDAVGVVQAEDIEHKNARTLPDALSFESAVHMQKTNHGGGSPFIRGMTGKDVLILIDGVRFNNSTFRYGPNQYLNTIDPSLVERIEVVRGPGSVMYGSDALGGVINIITKKPSLSSSKPLYSSFTSRFGSQDKSTFNRLDLCGKTGFVHWQGGATVKKFNDLRGGGDTGLQHHTGYGEVDWNFSLSSRLGRGSLVFSSGRSEQDDVPRTDKFIFSNTSYVFEPQRYTFANALYDLPQPVKGVNTFHVGMSYQHQEERIQQFKIGDTTRKITNDETGTMGFQCNAVSMTGASNSLVYGFEWYRDEVSSSAQNLNTSTHVYTTKHGNFPDGSRFSSYGVYLEDHYMITQEFDATVGVRYSGFSTESDLPGYGRFEDSVSDMTWSGALSWMFAPAYRLNLKVSRGFRAPNLDDTVVLGKETGVGVDIPSPGLKPVSVTDYEIVLKTCSNLFDGDLALYYMDFTDMIGRQETSWQGQDFRDNNSNGVFDKGDEVFWGKVNMGDSRIMGVEHSLAGRLGSFKLRESVIYTYGEDLDTDLPLTRIPPLKAMVGIGRNFTEKWDTEFIALMASNQNRLSPIDKKDPRIPDGGTPGYAVFDIRSSFAIGDNTRFILVLENLTDSDYKEHGSGVWGPGRGISAGLTVRTW